MPNVTLYQLPTVVQLTQSDAVSVGTVLNRTDFNIFRNITNEVEFLIKDIDRKPTNLTNTTLCLYIVDRESNHLVEQVNLNVISPTKGHCRLVLTDVQTAKLSIGYYRYSVTIVRETDQVALYTSPNHSITGFIEVFEGPLPPPQSAVEIQESSFYPNSWGSPLMSYLVAGSFAGAAQRNNGSCDHTVALYSNNFSGTFWVQGSLNNTAPQDALDWFPVSQTVISPDNSVTGIQFTGNYMWVRFYYQASVFNTGSITKVLFKN